MNYNQLGTSDLNISEISFGCMSLEIEKGQNSISPLLRKAYESGINFFDTANLYDQGLNEEIVGTALKPIRDKILIATKVGNVWREDGAGWDWNPTKEHILTEVNESLRRLQTDYIDLYQLHGGTIDDPIDDIIEAFEQLKKQGKIRAYGISSIRPNVIREYASRSDIDSVMMQYSLLDRRPEESCLQLLDEQNISVITRGTLAKGMLIDKPAQEYLGYSKNEVKKIQSAVENTGLIATSIQYVLSHPAVASAVLGIRTEDQLNEIIQNFKQSVTGKSLKEISDLLEPNTYEKHR
ncbi:MAG: aldo/keto reductase [Gracilimonas sp.]|uniref:aldo/keto reductase n=1 Tax=Gracilimonas sp. TaxID=1974203 RepID=UPI0019C331C4|nr:aldo/keto reductase [Gracilimonas sp.]MBD3615220.1 aldo/keto reductase [Gracilimonas sp.]